MENTSFISCDIDIVPSEHRLVDWFYFRIDVRGCWLHRVCVGIRRQHVASEISLLNVRIHCLRLSNLMACFTLQASSLNRTRRLLRLCLLRVTEGHVWWLELIYHVLWVVRSSVMITSVVLPILRRIGLSQDWLWALVKSHLDSLVFLFIVFCIGILLDEASTDISERPVWVCLHRRSFLIAHVAQFLLLGEHSLLILGNLCFIARNILPIDLTCASIHRGLIESFVVLFLGWDERA